MRARHRPRSSWRLLVSLVLALVAIARGGGATVACESFAPPGSTTSHTDHQSGTQGAEPEHGGCDAPERVSECLLMPACAPAVSVALATTGDVPTSSEAVLHLTPRAPAPVDRAPEPPPPRA